MKALTIKQPYAWLIMAGVKRVENRPRKTSHRGQLIIHAGSNRDALRALLASGEYQIMQDRFGLPEPDRLTYGAALGFVTLTDDLDLEAYRAAHPLDAFAVGPRCYRLASPQRFSSPVFRPGQLGFWNWPHPLPDFPRPPRPGR